MPLLLDYVDKKSDDNYAFKEYNCEYDSISLVPLYDKCRYKTKKFKKRVDDITKIVEKHYGKILFKETSRIDIKKRFFLTKYLFEKEDESDLIFQGSDCLEDLNARKKYQKRRVRYFNLEFVTEDGSVRGEIKPGDYKNLRWKFKLELVLATALIGAGAIGYNCFMQAEPLSLDSFSDVVNYVKTNYNMDQVVNQFKDVWANLSQSEVAKPIKQMLSWLGSTSGWVYGGVIGNYVKRMAKPYVIDAYNGMKVELSPLKNSYSQTEAERYKDLCHDLTAYNVHNYTGYQHLWKWIKSGGLFVGGKCKDLGHMIADKWGEKFTDSKDVEM